MPKRESLRLLVLVSVMILATASCSSKTLDTGSFDSYLSDDGLYHETGTVDPWTGKTYAEGSASEGLATTALVLRTFATEGVQDKPPARVRAAVEKQAPLTSNPADLLNAARSCKLLASTADSCAAAEAKASQWLLEARQSDVPKAVAIELLESAADLKVRTAATPSRLSSALELSRSDACVMSAMYRYQKALGTVSERKPSGDPRAISTKVIEALKDGDLSGAFCESGIASVTAGAIPVGEDDWLRQPFHDALQARFRQEGNGLYELPKSGLGVVTVTSLLSQVSLDLAVELPDVR